MTTICVNCRGPVGGDTGEIPMRVSDERGGEHEVWCPQCFTWKRAPLEPHRFHWDSIAAVKCGRCGVTSVDFGRRACPQCLAPLVTALPPKLVTTPASPAEDAVRPERSKTTRSRDNE